MDAMSEPQPTASVLTGLKRGLSHRCPNCGDGRLYRRYLKVAPVCEACGHELGLYPADDGPAYFTIFLVGHIIIAPLLFFRWIWEASPLLVVPVTLIPLHAEPDGHFPHGIPNPLLPECREDTARAVRACRADMGIAWDGDFDRCFLFDERGDFIEGYYIVGLLAESFLLRNPGSRIIHDPRLQWNTQQIVQANGGVPVMSKTGHAFIKERMRAEDAIYGGEMSAHHYFRDFAYCDSGMIPWLLVAALMSHRQLPLSALVAERIAAYPSSGEINSHLAAPQDAIRRVYDHYVAQAVEEDHTDGISLAFDGWRFNLRSSNTEPVVRLNVESRADPALMAARTEEILTLLRQEA